MTTKTQHVRNSSKVWAADSVEFDAILAALDKIDVPIRLSAVVLADLIDGIAAQSRKAYELGKKAGKIQGVEFMANKIIITLDAATYSVTHEYIDKLADKTIAELSN